MAYFQVDDDAITLTEKGQRFAGSDRNTASTRGQMLASMAVRVLNRIDENIAPTGDTDKSTFLYETMTNAADAAQPPLSDLDREAFMAGARQVLGGNE